MLRRLLNSISSKEVFPRVLAVSIALVVPTGLVSREALGEVKLITFEEIKRISPWAKDDYAHALEEAEDAFKKAGIDTRLRMAHFIGQVMTETGGLDRLDENMNYSYESLLRVFSRKRVPEVIARKIARKEREVANWVYGEILGNRGRSTSDGWDYRGSGYIQLTGRENFAKRGKQISLPLREKPELARQPREGILAAIAYWEATNINLAADDHDLFRVRQLVNGKKPHGFPQSKEWFRVAWTKVFQNKTEDDAAQGEELVADGDADETTNFDEMLKESGILPDGFEALDDPAIARSEALKRFQRELGLDETGVLDEETKKQLFAPREFRHLDDSDIESNNNSDPEGTDSIILDGKAETENANGANEAAAIDVTLSEAGNREPASDQNISQIDMLALENATGIYSEYEMGGTNGNPDPQGIYSENEMGGTHGNAETFVPFSVFVPDERVQEMDPTSEPARKIAQILFQSASGSEHICTGTLISTNTVLTAAHCIHSGTVSGSWYKNFRVIPGRDTGRAPFGQCLARGAFVLDGWTASLSPKESRYYDLGALKLDCEVGKATGWVGIRALSDGDAGMESTVQGYSGKKAPQGVQWISKDKLRVLWQHKGFYKNDTFGGTSGAPVFQTGLNDILVGVHTNAAHGQEEPWKSNNAFTRITPERLQRIQEWIQN